MLTTALRRTSLLLVLSITRGLRELARRAMVAPWTAGQRYSDTAIPSSGGWEAPDEPGGDTRCLPPRGCSSGDPWHLDLADGSERSRALGGDALRLRYRPKTGCKHPM